MDRKIALFIGARIVDNRRFRWFLFEATRACAPVLNFHLALGAFQIARQVVGNCERVGHRKGEQEQQKRGENAFHDRNLIHSRNEPQGVN